MRQRRLSFQQLQQPRPVLILILKARVYNPKIKAKILGTVNSTVVFLE